MAKKIIPFIVVFLLSVIFGFSLFHSGLPPTHDGEYHVIRFYEFDKSLRDGNWYPRWASDLNQGFGIPLFNYSYPLPNYISSLIHLAGLSFIDIFKVELYLSILTSGIFFYLWTKHFFGKLGGLVCASFYIFSPYHIVDVYVRGSIGESWALAFYPALLWSITQYRYKNTEKYFFLSILFTSLVIFSHNILALQFIPLFITYGVVLSIVSKNKLQFLFKFFVMLILGIGTCAIFWLPALLEKQYVVGLQIYDVLNHFPDLYELIIPSWGSGFFTSEPQNRMSVQIGIANLFAFFTSSISVWLYLHKKNNLNMIMILFFSSWFVILFFLMQEISKDVWLVVPFMNYFQFPWRFLGISILCLSFLSGSLFGIVSKKTNSWFIKIGVNIIFFLFFILPILFSLGYIKVPYYLEREDSYYLSRPNFIYGTNSVGNAFNTVWFDTSLKHQSKKIILVKGKGFIKNEKFSSTNYLFNTESHEPLNVQINTAYFPGWKVSIDGNQAQITEKRGIMFITIPSGHHLVAIYMEETDVQKIAFAVTSASITFLLALSIWQRYVRIKK